MSFLGVELEDWKIWFLIISSVYALLQFLRGSLLVPFVIIVCVSYLFYRENKSEDWQNFLSFLKDFKHKEKVEKEWLETHGYKNHEQIIEEGDEEVLRSLVEEMEGEEK